VIPLPDGFYERSSFCKKKTAFLWILPLPMVGVNWGTLTPHALAGLLVIPCDSHSLTDFMSVLVFCKKRRVSLDFASANGWSTWGTLIPTCFGWLLVDSM